MRFSPEAVPASGERKHITVLFADVAGSMDLQEDLDPEVWAQIMGRFVAILAERVRRFGGTVDKFTGDGIMALFGAPVAQEHHASTSSAFIGEPPAKRESGLIGARYFRSVPWRGPAVHLAASFLYETFSGGPF